MKYNINIIFFIILIILLINNNILEYFSDINKKILDFFIKYDINKDNYIKKNKKYLKPDNIKFKFIGKNIYNQEIYLEEEAANAYLKMKNKALKDGVNLKLLSGFRSYDYQDKIIQKKLEKKISLENILKLVKLPGFSQHHTGKAIDFVSEFKFFENSDQYKWLKNNAKEFGFYMSYPKNNNEMIFEPWHWFYTK